MVLKMYTKQQLMKKYGYLMDREHGNDSELLMDIMQCNGIKIKKYKNRFIISDIM